MTFEMGFPDGTGTKVVGDGHPLVSVFRKSSVTGKFTGNWLYLTARPAPGEPPKMLGAFALTPGNRLLHFPGTDIKVQNSREDKTLDGSLLDHYTLELDGQGSRFDEHIAVLGTTEKGRRGLPRSGLTQPGHLHSWLTLIIPNLDRYEDLPAQYEWQLEWPKVDIERRARAMICEGKRTDLTFPDPIGTGPHYYQLDIWAGRGLGWDKKLAGYLPYAADRDMVSNHRGEVLNLVGKTHHLSEHAGIGTVLTRPSGILLRGGTFQAPLIFSDPVV